MYYGKNKGQYHRYQLCYVSGFGCFLVEVIRQNIALAEPRVEYKCSVLNTQRLGGGFMRLDKL